MITRMQAAVVSRRLPDVVMLEITRYGIFADRGILEPLDRFITDATFNQDDLIELRTQKGVDRLVPGLTGWAQINGRDELPIPLKVEFDVEYLRRQSFYFDLKIIFLTSFKVISSKGVTH